MKLATAPRSRIEPGRSPAAIACLAILAVATLAAAGPKPERRARAAATTNLPRVSDAYRETRACLPRRFIEYDTARFILLSDADPAWSRAQASRLERTRHQFNRFADRLDLERRPLAHKLVCVLFARRDDYIAFATEHDGVVDPWIAGYYAPEHDRIVFYHGETNPSVVEARATLLRMREDVAAIVREASVARRAGRLEQATVLEEHGGRFERHLERETRRVDAFAGQVNVSTLVHEAVHQLMFHTGVQSPRVASPVWISEGIATAFETDDTGGAFGPDFEHAPRREAFARLVNEDALLDLGTLVTISRLPNDDRVVHTVYHESYALVRWMGRYRRAELRRYLDLVRRQPAGPIAPDRALALFEQAFGNVDTLERVWRRHERVAHGSIAMTPTASESPPPLE